MPAATEIAAALGLMNQDRTERILPHLPNLLRCQPQGLLQDDWFPLSCYSAWQRSLPNGITSDAWHLRARGLDTLAALGRDLFGAGSDGQDDAIHWER